MSANTTIEWCSKTWNPVRGCSRVSPGCDHCYAMGQAHRFAGPGKPYEGLTTIRRGKVDWSGVARFVPGALDEPLRWRKPERVFVNSMSDLFHHSLSFEQIAAVFGVMAACPQHTFLVLTKRPERAVQFFSWLAASAVSMGGPTVNAARGARWFAWNFVDESRREFRVHDPEQPWIWPLPNVHLGVSCENQETADERIPLLLKCPAAVHWVSAEPLLGPLNLHLLLCTHANPEHPEHKFSLVCNGASDRWVVVGGESGPGARPFDLAWARSIVEQCETAEVPCFVKQFGRVVVDSDREAGGFYEHDRRSIAAAAAPKRRRSHMG